MGVLVMNAYLSSSARWGASANLLGAAPSEWGTGDALALGLVATLLLLGLAARALERGIETRRQKAAKEERERIERKKRDYFRSNYVKNGGTGVIETNFNDDFDEMKHVAWNNRRDLQKRTTANPRRQAGS